MRTDIIEKKEQILTWINDKKSKTYICKELRCKPETLNFWLRKLGINYCGQQAGRGLLKSKIPLENILSNSVEFSNSQLKKRLIHENIIENKCCKCNLVEWLGNPITLELDHINGNRFDNNINNLRLLCPNCHSQTETFRKKKGRN